MKNDLFIRVSLVVVAVLLALNLLVQLGKTSSPAYAATGKVQYKVVQWTSMSADQLEGFLNKYGVEGWELVMNAPVSGHWIFKK